MYDGLMNNILMHCKNIRKPQQFSFENTCSKFILDVDTGCDDAQFLLLMIHLARKFGKEIIGITCVDGNAELENVVTNTLICIKMCNAKIPVYRGAKSNIQGYTAKDNYFGSDGLNSHQSKYATILGPEEYALVQKKNAFLFISDSAEQYGKDLAIIATGPLTNIAISYLLNNEIPNLIGGFTIMGGSYSGVGLNHMFSAEFNFHGDVDAAHLVVKNFKNIIMIPLELALEAPSTRSNEFFASEKTPKGLFVKDLFKDMFKTLCDPLAAFPMLMPKSITGVYNVYGEVCREGTRTKGFLAIDWLKMKGANEPNLKIICHMDWEMVFNTMVESLE